MKASAEFLVEPFTEGELGPHVVAALEAFRECGFEVEVGPFANTVSGDPDRMLSAIEAAMRRAIEAGATRFGVDFTVDR